MKLADYIIDIGRPVAYYPKLKEVTGSTTSTILLCQLLYWSDKTDDGWIWKSANEIEEETGLTEDEQETAKIRLIKLSLIEYEYKRLQHKTRYKVNQDEFNNCWEAINGAKIKPIIKKQPKENINGQLPLLSNPDLAPEPKKIVKKGDFIDALMVSANSPELRKMEKMNELRSTIEKKLNVNVENKKWDMFIEFAYNRQEKDKQPLSRFIEWALANGFNPIYWTPEKMKTVWPQAFIKQTSMMPREDFVQKLPEIIEKERAPMPKDIGRPKDIFD